MIGFIDTFFTISLNHNQLQQLTINGCLRLAPFLTGPRVSSFPLWRLTDEDSLRVELSFMLRPTVSRPVYLGIKHPFGAYDQIFITCVTVTVCSCGAPSLTRGQVCLIYILCCWPLPAQSGTRDHILLSQIWDFPFCRLLRLAGSRWRYCPELK
jgi:hypothetical protein